MKKILKGIKSRLDFYKLYLKNRDVLVLNRDLKNIHSGKRCFIIGNGPSVKDQDLIRLKNEYTIVVNSFWNYEKYAELNPKYYVLIDGDVFPKEGSKLNFFSEQFLEKIPLLSSCGTEFFFHIRAKKFFDETKSLQNSKVYYILSQGNFKEKGDFSIDISTPIPYGKNVIVTSIILASYMGFNEVYLLGCEHDFLAYQSEQHYQKFPHFFNNPYEFENKKENLKSYYAIVDAPYETRIHQALTLFKNYRLLKEKLANDKPDLKIYNATPNSFLDVFPRVKFEGIKL